MKISHFMVDKFLSFINVRIKYEILIYFINMFLFDFIVFKNVLYLDVDHSLFDFNLFYTEKIIVPLVLITKLYVCIIDQLQIYLIGLFTFIVGKYLPT